MRVVANELLLKCLCYNIKPGLSLKINKNSDFKFEAVFSTTFLVSRGLLDPGQSDQGPTWTNRSA